MAAIIDFLKQNDSYLYPITLTTAVYDLNGKTLDIILNSYLPLAGGTMTGAISFTNIASNKTKAYVPPDYNKTIGAFQNHIFISNTNTIDYDSIVNDNYIGGTIAVGNTVIEGSVISEDSTAKFYMGYGASRLYQTDTIGEGLIGVDEAGGIISIINLNQASDKTFNIDVETFSGSPENLDFATPTNKTYISMSPEQFDFGRVDYDSSGNELPPQDGDAIIFQYYDSANAKYRTAMSIDGLNGSIYVAKKISSDEVIKAKYFTSTTPIEITIGSCTKTWDGHSPLSFTLDEINGTAATAMAYSDDEDMTDEAVMYSAEEVPEETVITTDEETSDEPVI